MSEVLLITGGSRGIGAATARLAASRGFDVALNYRADRAAADAVVGGLISGGVRASAFQADVADESEVVALFEAVEVTLGTPTALVNSAGVGLNGATVDLESGALTRMMAVNATGTMLCCREAARRMALSRGGHGGSIVNVSSMASTIGGRVGAAAYAASKAAVDAFTVGLARELADDGVRVNAVRPGMTRTEMTFAGDGDHEASRRIAETIGMNRIAEADEIAAPILWLLSQEASYVAGACLDVSGGGFWIGPRIAGERSLD